MQDKLRIREQARRVAWRQLLRWVQAQMAMIQCGMAESGEVFFAYLQSPCGQSIFEVFAEQGLRMLPPGEEDTVMDQPYIVCPKCGTVSHNPNDVRERYCGACHAFHDDALMLPSLLRRLRRVSDGQARPFTSVAVRYGS